VHCVIGGGKRAIQNRKRGGKNGVFVEEKRDPFSWEKKLEN